MCYDYDKIILFLMCHPFINLFRDRDIRTLWGGLTFSAIGSELYAIGAIWLAVSIADASGAYLVTARYAAILVVSIAAGAFVDLISRRSLLIGSDIIRTIFSLLVVVIALTSGLTLPILILASAALAGVGAIFQPTLQSSLPRLINNPIRLRETNGLFDATIRCAQAVGPFFAAAVISFIPVIHLLTLNALSFLASAGAIAKVGHRITDEENNNIQPTFRRKLLRGIHAASCCPGSWQILFTTMVRAGAFALGFTVGIPLFFVQSPQIAIAGIVSVALIIGISAVSEIIFNLLIVMKQPKRPWQLMFMGYMTIGLGLLMIGIAQILPFSIFLVLVMMLCAIIVGLGNTMAGIQMLTFFGDRMNPDDFSSILRLRLVLVTGAAMISTALAPFLFGTFGTPKTVIGCGAIILIVAFIVSLSEKK